MRRKWRQEEREDKGVFQIGTQRCCAPTKKKTGRTEVRPYMRKQNGDAKGYYRDAGAAEATAVLPMASPLTTSSTRRLCWRPSGVSFEGPGCVLSKPRAVKEYGATPFSARKYRTEYVRRSQMC